MQNYFWDSKLYHRLTILSYLSAIFTMTMTPVRIIGIYS